MANRLFTSQFSCSFEKQVVHLIGAFTQVSPGSRASLVNQAVTYTAVAFGSAGNQVSITLINPGTPSHALSISVVGSAISVTLQTDSGSVVLTTATLLVAALLANSSVTALVSVSGSGSTPLIALTQTPLAGGADLVTTNNLPISFMNLSQTDTGLYEIALADKYMALLSVQIMHQAASATALRPQMISESVGSSKLIDFRMVSSSTPTNLQNGDVLYFDINLRNIG